MELKNYDPNDLKMGREYVRAYIAFVPFVAHLYEQLKHSDIGH